MNTELSFKATSLQIVKLLAIWLGINVLAGVLTGLVFMPFSPNVKWDEHALFLGKLFIGIGLFYFAASECGIYPRTIAQIFLDEKRKHFTIAFKYFLSYVGFLVLAVGVLVGAFTFLNAFIKTPDGYSKLLGGGKDILRLTALSFSAPGGVTLFLLSTCVLAPIIEELFYRQLLFSEFRKYFNFLISMLLSSFIFGIFHASIVIAAINGAYLAYVYEKKESLPANIILHSLLNLFSLILMIGVKKL